MAEAATAGHIVQVGLSSFFGAVGMVSRNSTLISWGTTVAKPAGVFWIGTLIIVVAGLLLVSGTRRYFTVQRVLFVIAVAGLAVIAVVMIFGSRSSFQSNLTSLTGLDPGKVVSSATKGGFATAPTSFSDSARFLIWPLLPLRGALH